MTSRNIKVSGDTFGRVTYNMKEDETFDEAINRWIDCWQAPDGMYDRKTGVRKD